MARNMPTSPNSVFSIIMGRRILKHLAVGIIHTQMPTSALLAALHLDTCGPSCHTLFVCEVGQMALWSGVPGVWSSLPWQQYNTMVTSPMGCLRPRPVLIDEGQGAISISMMDCPTGCQTILWTNSMGCLVGKAGSTVRFEIMVRYEIFGAKSTVRNYGTIYFPRYCTVRKYDIFFVLFSNLFHTNLIIEHRPLRYVRNQDLYRFRHVSMTYSKLYRVLYIVQKKKRSPHPFLACLSSIWASYRRPSRQAHNQDFGLYNTRGEKWILFPGSNYEKNIIPYCQPCWSDSPLYLLIKTAPRS